MAWIEERQTSDGPRWRVLWYEDGKRQRVVFYEADSAVRFRHLVEGHGGKWPPGWAPGRAPGPLPATTKLTFGQWATRAVTNRTRANERTKADYRRDLQRHFTDLNNIPLDEVDDDAVTAWADARRAAGLADKTLRNLYGFASSLYADALRQRPPLAEHNPFDGRLSQKAAVHIEEMVFLTPQEFAVVAALVREQYRPLIRLLAGTGLRYGEATALTAGDVDLLAKRRTLTVSKAWKRVGPARYEVGEPKTPRSRRTLSLSDELVELLIPVWTGRRRGELLFPGAGGGRLPHVEVWKRGWAPAVARARVCDEHYAPQRDGRGKPPLMPEPCQCPTVLDKQPRIHDLRHSQASWLISDGIPLPAISRRLGHSSINITIDRYGHLDPSLDDQVNAAVDRALAPTVTPAAALETAGSPSAPPP